MNNNKYYRVRQIKERGYNASFYVEHCDSFIAKIFNKWNRDKKPFTSLELSIDYINKLKRMNIIDSSVVYKE